MRYVAALVGALATVGFAGPVHADPTTNLLSAADAGFLAALDAAGVTYRRGDQAILTARMVCRFIAEGKPSAEVLEGLQERNPGLSTEHGTQFVGIAVHSYCPERLVQADAP